MWTEILLLVRFLFLLPWSNLLVMPRSWVTMPWWNPYRPVQVLSACSPKVSPTAPSLLAMFGTSEHCNLYVGQYSWMCSCILGVRFHMDICLSAKCSDGVSDSVVCTRFTITLTVRKWVVCWRFTAGGRWDPLLFLDIYFFHLFRICYICLFLWNTENRYCFPDTVMYTMCILSITIIFLNFVSIFTFQDASFRHL